MKINLRGSEFLVFFTLYGKITHSAEKREICSQRKFRDFNSLPKKYWMQDPRYKYVDAQEVDSRAQDCFHEKSV